MRKIRRNQRLAPDILQSEQYGSWRREIARHFSLPLSERHKRRVAPGEDLYTDPGLRSALNEQFSRKCAYCERELLTASDAVAASYRPLTNACNLGEREGHPDHYVWFAYEWRNFLLLCRSCEQAKRNIFPVEGPRAVPLCTWSEADESEETLLLDPCKHEPWKHVIFGSDGIAWAKSSIGTVTIAVVTLNRPELVAQRKDHLQRVVEILLHGDVEEVLQQTRSDRPFSGVTSTFLYELCRTSSRMNGLPSRPFSRLEGYLREANRQLRGSQWREVLDEFTNGLGSDDFSSRLGAPASHMFSVERSERSARISRIEIEWFKGIDQLVLDLIPPESSRRGASCTMLLGENSTGKSTVLQAIALCCLGAKERRSLRISAEDFISRERAVWQMIGEKMPSIRLHLDNGDLLQLGVDPVTRTFESNHTRSTVLLAYGARRFFVRRKTRAGVSSIRTLFNPATTIPDPTPWLELANDYEFDAVSRAMREILSLRPDDTIERLDDRRVLVRAHGRITPIANMSDGYRSLFAMTVDVMRHMIDEWGNLEDARGVVLIDEIEIHLHPRWKMRVMSALRRAMPNVQFIATTHDPLCLRGMFKDEVQVLVRDEEDVVRSLADLPDVSLLRTEQLLTSDYFGLSSTADPDFESELEQYSALASIPSELQTAHQRSEFERLEKRVEGLELIGDTPSKQLVVEAIRRYLHERPRAILRGSSVGRESAVREILRVLNHGRPQ